MTMNDLELKRRLEAWQRGTPVPRRETLPVRRRPAAQTWILTGVRMSGEALPWGVAFGSAADGPEVWTTPEPRSVDAVVELLAAFGRRLRAWLHDTEDPLWVGPGVTELLHLVALRFARARYAAPDVLETLRELGRVCDFVFTESARPGQLLVHEAGAVLRDLHTFPAEDHRQQHLGFLVGWLRGGERSALRHERRAVSTALDPELEREVLQPLLERQDHVGVERVVRREVLRRWALVRRAVRAIERDPRPELSTLEAQEDLTQDQREWFVRREGRRAWQERPFDPDARGDVHPAVGAGRYFDHLHGHDVERRAACVGDRARRSEAQAAGDLVEARLVSSVAQRGQTRKHALWTLRTSYTGPLRLREGAKVCDLDDPSRQGILQRVEADAQGRTLEVLVTKCVSARQAQGRRSAFDPTLIGQAVWLGAPWVELNQRKAQLARERGGPGEWWVTPTPRPETADEADDVLALVEQLKEG